MPTNGFPKTANPNIAVRRQALENTLNRVEKIVLPLIGNKAGRIIDLSMDDIGL